MLAVIGLAGLLLAVAVASGWSGTTRLSDQGDASEEVEATTRAFAEAYGGFDFRDPDRYRQRLLELSSGDLRAALSQSVVDPVAIGQQRSTLTTVAPVTVTALSDGKATASVGTEQRRRWVDARSGRMVEETVHQRIALRLVLEGDQWRVTEFRLVSEEPVRSSGESNERTP